LLRAAVLTVPVAMMTMLVASDVGGLQTVHAQSAQRVSVLIGFRNNPGAAEDAVVRGAGGQITHRYSIVRGVAATLPEAAIAALQRNPNVTSVEPDLQVFALDAYDTELDGTWGVKRVGGGLSATGGAGIHVAVIDTGVDCNHPELTRSGATICDAGWDFVNGGSVAFDDNGHGTHVSGTIAAAKDGAQVVGVAPGVTIHPLKVLDANGSGSFSNIIAALDWVKTYNGNHPDAPIRITSNSYGSSGNPGSLTQAAFDSSAAAGVLHIAAAGNSGICSGKTDTVGYPAKYASVVAVAATDSNNVRPCFSSTGPDVELSAPGVAITSTIPNGGYDTWNGTSMATPHVSGVAALVLEAKPTLTASEVRSILTSSATDLGVAGRDTLYGFGLVNATAAVAAATGSGGGGGGGGQTGGTLSMPNPIAYSLSANRRNLLFTLSVVSGGSPFAGAAVSVQLKRNGVAVGTGTATTGTNGQVTFQLQNAPSGSYKTTVTGVTASGGYTWDGVQPPDPGFTK
jgi:subtilisin family serine protease